MNIFILIYNAILTYKYEFVPIKYKRDNDLTHLRSREIVRQEILVSHLNKSSPHTAICGQEYFAMADDRFEPRIGQVDQERTSRVPSSAHRR